MAQLYVVEDSESGERLSESMTLNECKQWETDCYAANPDSPTLAIRCASH